MIRFARIAAVLICAASLIHAQDRRKVDINGETPEGQALQKIGGEEDAAKKLALLEEFTTTYAASPNVAWVLGQMHPLLVKASQWDKVIAVTEKLMAMNPADAEMAHGALKAAEAKGDVDAIIKWAGLTNEAGKKAEKLPKPAGADDDEDVAALWKHQMNFGNQVQKYCEYSLFSTAARSQDASARIKLIDGLVAMNPSSEYVPQTHALYFDALRQTGANDKALAFAEERAGKNEANEDMLLLVANSYFEKQNADKTVEMGTKLADYLRERTAPQGVDAATWEKKRNTTLGAGLFLVGMTHASKGKLAEADTTLKEAVPLIEDNQQLLGLALFQLGLVNYRLGSGKSPNRERIQAAYAYSQRAAGIPGPTAAQARKNVDVIKQQFGGLLGPAPAAKKTSGKKK